MTTDPYSHNAIAERFGEWYPERYAQVSKVKEPPKMFEGGRSDLPAFTASGIDPQLLLQLPAGARHAAAAETDISVVHRFFETYGGMGEVEVDHEGLRAAKQRVQHWLEKTDLDTRNTEEKQAEADAIYVHFFNPTNDRRAWFAEDKRRREAGEPGLPDFGTGEMERFWAREQAGADQ